MSSAINLYQLSFDPSDTADSANVGAYIRAGSDGELIDSTSNALHVLLTNASIAVTATDLDVRDLSHTQDSVKIGDGTDFLAIASDGSIAVTQSAFDTVGQDVITVGTSAVELVAGTPVANRRYLLIQNKASNSIFVGSSAVTTSNGVEVPKGGNIALDASGGVYAIAAGAGNAVRVLELGYGS